MAVPKRLIGDAVLTRKAALAHARAYGCSVTLCSGGEALIIAPDGSRARINNRRKDAPRALLQLLRRIEPNVGGPGGT